MPKLDHLVVYLTNACNLACDYCYVAVNKGPGAKLSLESIERALREFRERTSPHRRVTFLGGEPLLDWNLLLNSLRSARSCCGPRAVIQTFTNGTLLTPAKVAAMAELGVICTISLDGARPENDAHRVYHADPRRSVHDAVMSRLEPLEKSCLGVSMVITPESADRLLANVASFHQIGLRRITFNPAVYARWPESRISVLRKSLSGVARWLQLLLESGVTPPHIAAVDSILAARRPGAAGARRWRDCHNMVLGPDANYYACDKALSFPIGDAPDLRTGDADGGMDWRARDGILGEIVEWIDHAAAPAHDSFCPVGVVAHARQDGRDPAAALAEFRAASSAFSAGLSELLDACSKYPAFREMYGLPAQRALARGGADEC